MSWFLKEISEVKSQVRLCMEDGRLLVGQAIGVDTSINPIGILNFKANGTVYKFKDKEIADYIVL